MSASERVTWETCPSCGLSAAVGWRNAVPIEVDCPGGCRLDARVFSRRTPVLRSFASVGLWAAADRGREGRPPVTGT